MPQKWERELQKVNSLRAPASTRTRIEGGPHGDGLPPQSGRGQRLLAGGIAFAVFAGALAFAVHAFGQHQMPPAASITNVQPVTFIFAAPPPGEPRYPTATMATTSGPSVEGVLPFAEWPLVEVDLDKPTLDTWHEVTAGAPIVIDGTADSVRGWVDSCCDESMLPPHLSELDLVGGSSIPPETGRYVLEFSARWPEGSQTFLFPIQVVAPDSPQPDAAILTLMSTDGPTGELTYQGATAPVQVGSYCWNEGPQLCAETVVKPFKRDQFLQIPAGTHLFLETDGSLGSVVLALGEDPLARPPSLWRVYDELDADIGRYVLHVPVSWPQGDIDFYFPVELTPIQTPASTDPAADGFDVLATMSTPVDGSAPGLVLEGEGTRKSYPGAGRWAGESVFVASMLFSFDQPLPTGAVLLVAGDADRTEMHVSAAQVEGGWGDPVGLDVSSGRAILPIYPGAYLLELEGWWPQGHMLYSVAITIGHPSEPSASPLPSVEVGVVPDVVGIGAGDAEKLLSQAGYETDIRYAPIPGVSAGIVDSMAPEPGISAPTGSRVLLRVSGTDVPLDGYLTQLNCSQADMMPFADDGARDLPTPPTYITVNLSGFQEGDELTQIRFDNSQFPGAGIWQASRDGHVIAVIAVPSLEGIACRGSGIAGA